MARMTTYSFRAPVELGERLQRARGALTELRRPEGETILRELNLRLARRSEALGGFATQSELIREVVEILVEAVEKVEANRRWHKEYAAYAAGMTAEEREEERQFGEASAEIAARLYEEEEEQ
jgi:hypothetical protein